MKKINLNRITIDKISSTKKSVFVKRGKEVIGMVTQNTDESFVNYGYTRHASNYKTLDELIKDFPEYTFFVYDALGNEHIIEDCLNKNSFIAVTLPDSKDILGLIYFDSNFQTWHQRLKGDVHSYGNKLEHLMQKKYDYYLLDTL
jgi:hypothetical protein